MRLLRSRNSRNESTEVLTRPVPNACSLPTNPCCSLRSPPTNALLPRLSRRNLSEPSIVPSLPVINVPWRARIGLPSPRWPEKSCPLHASELNPTRISASMVQKQKCGRKGAFMNTVSKSGRIGGESRRCFQINSNPKQSRPRFFNCGGKSKLRPLLDFRRTQSIFLVWIGK